MERYDLRRDRLLQHIKKSTSGRTTRSVTTLCKKMKRRQIKPPPELEVPTEDELTHSEDSTAETVYDEDIHDPLAACINGERYRYMGWVQEEYERRRQAEIGQQFHGFLHLPPEIRNMIYRLALVRGDIFVPNTIKAQPSSFTGEISGSMIRPYNMHDHCGEPRARYSGYVHQKSIEEVGPQDIADGLFMKTVTGGLLSGVSKQIQEGGEKIFWGENRVVFPAGYWESPLSIPGQSWNGIEGPPPPATDLSFAFDMRDAEKQREEFDNYFRFHDAVEAAEADGIDPMTLTGAQIRERKHDGRINELKEVWGQRCTAICAIGTLRRLQIDFEDCYCYDG